MKFQPGDYCFDPSSRGDPEDYELLLRQNSTKNRTWDAAYINLNYVLGERFGAMPNSRKYEIRCTSFRKRLE